MGWTEGQNVRIDIRWAGGNADLDRKFAAELVALTPDVVLATASPTVAALQGASRTVPIAFAHAVDPVGAGFVDSGRFKFDCLRHMSLALNTLELRRLPRA